MTMELFEYLCGKCNVYRTARYIIAQQIVERHDEKAGNYTMSMDFRTPRTPELDELYNRRFAGRMRLNGWRLRTDVRALHGLR